jgi:hypothetical protein
MISIVVYRCNKMSRCKIVPNLLSWGQDLRDQEKMSDVVKGNVDENGVVWCISSHSPKSVVG